MSLSDDYSEVVNRNTHLFREVAQLTAERNVWKAKALRWATRAGEAEGKFHKEVVRCEDLESRLHDIQMWCKAYPESVFIEPTDEQWALTNKVLEATEGCPSLTAIAGSNMRYVVEGLIKLAATGMKTEEKL